MKKIFIMVLAMVFFSVPAFAADWCKWVDGEAVDCLSDRKGVIMANNFPTRGAIRCNAKGWYKVIVTQPTLDPVIPQMRTDKIWGFADNEITQTWNVRDLTDPELDQRTSGAMQIQIYELWKAVMFLGITPEQAVNFLPPERIAAYAARNRLENP
jgi:hypothetical protein